MNVSNHHLAGRVVIVTGAGSGIRDPGSAVLPRLPSPRPERTFSASGAARPTCTKPPVHIPRSRRSLPTFAPTARPRPSSTRRLPVGKSRCAGDHCRGHRDNRARVSVRQCFYSVVSAPCRPATPGDSYRSVWPRGPSKSTTGQGLSLATIGRSDVTSRSWRGCCRLPRTRQTYRQSNFTLTLLIQLKNH
jgi:hypothetical protein